MEGLKFWWNQIHFYFRYYKKFIQCRANGIGKWEE